MAALVNGPFYTLPGTLPFFVASLLGLYVRLFPLGEVVVAGYEMRLARSARLPDILFIATANLDRVGEDRLDGPADLAIELVSDDSATRDRRDKLAEYEAAGVPEYWMLDPRPRQHRTAFHQMSPEGRYHSRVLPGFWLRPEWLWQDPLPDPVRLMAEIAPHAWRDPVLRPGAHER